MAKAASVDDLLESLEYGKPTEELDIIDGLRERFSLTPHSDLLRSLQQQAPGTVFAAILDMLRPFAFMVLDIYGFLADAAVRTNGHLEVHVPLSEAERLDMDLSKFRQFEQAAIQEILRSEFDYRLLNPNGKWQMFHDGYWPPNCIGEGTLFSHRDSRLPYHDMRCAVCPPETMADTFRRLTRYYEDLDRIASEHAGQQLSEVPTLPNALSWSRFRSMWADCKRRRVGDRNVCPMENKFSHDFVTGAVREFDAATRTISIADISRFLALPYWKKRWQLYGSAQECGELS